MQKRILGLTCMLLVMCSLALFIQNSHAQGDKGGGGPDGPSCNVCIAQDDITCSSNSASCDGTDCENVLFTVPCTGGYYFACKTSCTNHDDCYNCVTCSKILLNGTEIASCTSVIDQSGFSCENACETIPSGANVSLSANTWYTLRVCLSPCPIISPPPPPCNYCSGCKARARIYRASSNCTAW